MLSTDNMVHFSQLDAGRYRPVMVLQYQFSPTSARKFVLHGVERSLGLWGPKVDSTIKCLINSSAFTPLVSLGVASSPRYFRLGYETGYIGHCFCGAVRPRSPALRDRRVVLALTRPHEDD